MLIILSLTMLFKYFTPVEITTLGKTPQLLKALSLHALDQLNLNRIT